MGFLWSRHKNKGWKSQLYRCRRWHERVRKIGSAKSTKSDMEEEHDFVYAFFQNCYHLKDWVKNSGEIDPPDKVEDFINNHQEMRICADICNGTKHFTLKSSRNDDKYFSIGREYVSTDRPGIRPHINETWFIISGDTKQDIFELANKCMTLWENFLSENNLI